MPEEITVITEKWGRTIRCPYPSTRILFATLFFLKMEVSVHYSVRLPTSMTF